MTYEDWQAVPPGARVVVNDKPYVLDRVYDGWVWVRCPSCGELRFIVIELDRVQLLETAVPLADLRAAMPAGWRIPQGYGWVRGEAAEAMARVCGMGVEAA